MTPSHPLHRLARRASRRLALARFVRTMGIALPIALALAAVGILVDRLVGPGITWWWIGAGALGIALLVSVFIAWRSRAGAIAAASEIDIALKLKDRLASALALEGKTKDDPFASIALDEATALASRVSVHHAIPVRAERSWWWWPITAAALIGIGIFVPQMRLLEDRAQKLAAIEQIKAEQKADVALDDAAKKLEEALDTGKPEPGDFELAKELSKLADIKDQMKNGLKDPQEAAAEAASQIDEMANELDNKAAEAEASDAASQEMLDQAAKELAAPEPGTEEVDRMIEAMRKGDMEAAAKAAEDLEKAMESMSPEAAEKAAERLQQYADAVDRAAQQAQQNAANQAQKNAQDMANRGLSQQSASELSQKSDAGASQSDLEKQLRDQGMSPEAARELAKKISEASKNQRASNSACKNAGECSKSLRDGAKSLRECKGGSSSPSDRPGQKGLGNKPGRNGKPGDGEGEPGDGEGKNPGQGKGKGQSSSDGKKSWEVTAGQPTGGAGKGSALHNLKQKLTGNANAIRKAKQAAQQAQQLRVTKEDLLRQLADKSLKEKQQWLEQELAQGNQDKNWKYNNDDMDVREGVDDGQVIAQQHSPGNSPLPYNPGAISHRELTTELSAAMEATERAIEDRVIPSRYRNIQRYFQKSIQRAKTEAPAPPPAAPAPDAADAPAKQK